MDSRDQSATEAAAGAIRMHLFATTGWGPTHCRCQRDTTSADFGMDFPEHIEHVGAVVVAALNLTEEWNVVTDMGVQSYKPVTEERAKRMAELFEDMTARRRLVGPWVPVGLEGETP